MRRWVVETWTQAYPLWMTGCRPTFSYSLYRWHWLARLVCAIVNLPIGSTTVFRLARITGRVTIWRKDDMQQAARWAERCQRRWLEEWERPRVSALSAGQMAATAGEEITRLDAVMWDDGKIWRARR